MQTVMQTSDIQDQFLRHFVLQQERPAGPEPEWLLKQRREAFQAFQNLGLPTTRDEDWRYTNISPIVETAFQDPAPQPPEVKTLAGCWNDQVSARLVFVNGIYNAALSERAGLPAGMIAGNLRALLAEPATANLLRVYLGRTMTHDRRAFAALNSALWQDGACIFVPAGVALSSPVQVIHLSAADSGPLAYHPRTLVICERDSQLSLVETYQSLGDGISFSNSVSEVVAGESATVDLYHSVHEGPRAFHIGLLHVYAARSSQVSALSAAMGGALVRNEVHAVLDDEGADCTLNGLYAAKGVQHVDNHTTVDHARPNGSSRQLYNGILDGHSTGVFNGRVIVRQDAQKTDAVQKNRNLLLSADASIDSKPQLEISANDVRCAHGATVGQMDPEALFFLRSRGLDKEAATSMLVQAFASEILDKIKISGYRKWLESELHTRFLGASEKQKD